MQFISISLLFISLKESMKRIVFFLLVFSIQALPFFSFAKLDVVTIERPPFVFYENGKLTGFSIELLEAIKHRTGLQYTLQVETSFQKMLEKVKNKNADLAIANISITAEREKSMDFSYPIFDSGIQILEKKQDNTLTLNNTLKKVFLILLVLVLIHLAFKWMRENTQILWNIPSSAYLMVIWIIGWWWMVISFANYITPSVQADGDFDPEVALQGKHIGTSLWTTMSRFLDNHNIEYTPYKDYQQALSALESWEIDTLLADAAVARYYASHDGKEKVQLVWESFETDEIAIAFPSHSNIRKKINTILLKMKEDGSYEKLVVKYFGEE